MTKCGTPCKVRAALEVMRIHNVVVSLATTFIGYATLSHYFGLPVIPPIVDYYIAAITVALIAAAGYAINDYYDIDIDLVNKPWRPLPSGRLDAETVYMFSLALFVAGTMLAAILSGIVSGLYAGLVSILLYYYSKSLKRKGFIGNIVVAFNSASTILYGGLVIAERHGLFNGLWTVAIPFTYAFLLVLGREIVKGIEDYYGDLKGGAKTIPVIYGPRRALYISLVILIAVIALSPLPFILGIYNDLYMLLAGVVDALIFFSLLSMITTTSHVDKLISKAGTARAVLKWAFFVGAIAFILGTF